MGSISTVVSRAQKALLGQTLMIAIFAGAALAGVVLAVGAEWVLPDSAAVKVISAVLGSLMGTALAILGSRALQEQSDRRGVLRKAHGTILRIERLHQGYIWLDKELANCKFPDDAKSIRERADSLGAAEHGEVANSLLALIRTSEAPPDFDNMLESPEDRRRANRVLALFSVTRSLMLDLNDWKQPTEQGKRLVASWCSDIRAEDRRQTIRLLGEDIDYFQSRVPNL